jgi:hypothetical protein
MNKDDWGEVIKGHPEMATDLPLLARFLSLVDLALETRESRLQKALGVQHFLFLGQMEGLLLLARSAKWIAIPAIASTVFRLALEGVYLARNPKSLDDFVSFGWYESNCVPRIEGPERFRLEEFKEMQRDREKICETMRSDWENKTSWHGHTVDGLAVAVGMTGLLPLYRSAFEICNGNPAGFMSISKVGRLLFDRNREKSTPVMVSGESLLLVCCSTFYFYEEIVKVFNISNEIVLQSLDDLYKTLVKHNN